MTSVLYLNLLNFQLEDEQEKFDRLQMDLLLNDPDSTAFYNAQMRTQRRVRDITPGILG